jgi:dihydroxyacetone synthase
MAAIGVALWKYVMVYSPHTPDFFNRDRFVLSNGHTCLFQYCFLHLTGYKSMTMDQLKSYHSLREDSLCPGHPEIEHEGIEVTTGPLGQGVANAVGLAIATKHLAAEFNRPNYDIINNHTWCMIGDACLQEGVALEAISLAGHFKLNNLTIIYDNNQVTCDGSVDLTNNEDVNGKMRACGWDVITITDGCFDIEGIVSALRRARTSPEKPTFVNVRTIIGLGSAVAGDALSHGAAFGEKDVANMKRAAGFDPEAHFVIPDAVREFFADSATRGEKIVSDWNRSLSRYSEVHTDLAAQLEARRHGQLPPNWQDLIQSTFPERPTATRVSSGLVFNPIAQNVKSFMVGTADLSPSVNMIWKGKEDFQSPQLRTQCGLNGSYAGRYIHYGVREHAMAAVANGLAAYAPNTIIPVTSTYVLPPGSLLLLFTYCVPDSSCSTFMLLPLYAWERYNTYKSFTLQHMTRSAWAKMVLLISQSSLRAYIELCRIYYIFDQVIAKKQQELGSPPSMLRTLQRSSRPRDTLSASSHLKPTERALDAEPMSLTKMTPRK